MSVTTSGTTSAGLSWNSVDTNQSQARITDIGSVSIEYNHTAGSGTGTTNAFYHQVATLPSGGVDSFDLFSLNRTAFNANLNVNFSGGFIHDFIIVNNNGSGSIYLRATGVAGFTDILAGNTGIEIKPLSSYHYNNLLTGFEVGTGQRYLYINDGGLGNSYGLAWIGRTGVV